MIYFTSLMACNLLVNINLVKKIQEITFFILFFAFDGLIVECSC